MTLGGGLSDAYTATLMRLKAQKGYKSVLGLKVLMWVLYSERPLRAHELSHALGVEIGSTDLDPESAPALRTLISSCLGLVTVEVSSSTVRLVHFTLQEHLSRDPTLLHSPHSEIAEVCLTYLNFGCVRDLSPTLGSAPATTPLLEYASVYWGMHTRREMTENTRILALKLLDRFDEHISSQQVLLHYNRDRGGGPYFDGVQGPAGFTGLHGVAFLGIAGIAPAVLEMQEWNVNAYDCMGMTVLTWAAARGHEEVVKMFLGREDVNPDQADTEYGQTPLSWAAKNGHEGIVKMLLERGGVNPDQADSRYGQTPLSWAAKGGHEGIVKMLLEREDVDPNQADTEWGSTPLSWAARNGYEGILKMLLEREDVDPDQADTEYGLTPLSWAAGSGYEGIVKMLLQREDVDPDRAGAKDGRTPLSWAAGNRHEGIIKMLLQRDDVNPDQIVTKYGQTSLSWAVNNGHEGIVKMLLQRDDVNPDQTVTESGQRPLSWAAENGHEGIVKVLLQREGVNPDKTDAQYDRTPLSWAAEKGHEGIVKMLLERNDVNPNRADAEWGSTPLSLAATHGREGVVKILLEREDINPDQADTEDGRTPLSWAAEGGYEGITKMLLEREDVDPNRADSKYGRAPLSWAIEKGHEGIVNMLMKRKDVSTAMPGNMNQIAQLLTPSEGHDGAMGLRQELGTAGCATADRGGSTALPPSALPRDECVVEMQFRSHDPNPDTVDPNDEPARLLAAHREQPRLLDLQDSVSESAREWDNVDCTVADKGGPISPPPSAEPQDECIRETQFRSHDPSPCTIGPNDQPAPLPTTTHQRPTPPDPRDYVTGAADSGFLPQPPRRSQPLPIWPLGLCCRRRKIKTRPSNT